MGRGISGAALNKKTQEVGCARPQGRCAKGARPGQEPIQRQHAGDRAARCTCNRAWTEVMTRKQRRGVLIGTCILVLGVAVGLVLYAMRDSIVFFYTPSEVTAMQIAPGQRFRLGGLIETGSVVRG